MLNFRNTNDSFLYFIVFKEKSAQMLNSSKLDQEKLVFAQSPKGKRMLIHGGHKYVLAYSENDKIIWRCNSSNKFGCKAGATTTGENFQLLRKHNHPRESFPIKVVKVMK